MFKLSTRDTSQRLMQNALDTMYVQTDFSTKKKEKKKKDQYYASLFYGRCYFKLALTNLLTLFARIFKTLRTYRQTNRRSNELANRQRNII